MSYGYALISLLCQITHQKLLFTFYTFRVKLQNKEKKIDYRSQSSLVKVQLNLKNRCNSTVNPQKILEKVQLTLNIE